MVIFNAKKRSQIPIFISLFLSAIILISILLSAYMITISSAHKIIQSQMEDAKNTNFQSIINKIANTFSNAESLAYKVSASNVVTDYAKSTQRDHYTEYEIRKFLANLVTGYEDIKTCYIYLPQYDYILSSTIGLDSRSFFKRYYQNGYKDWMKSLHSNKNCLNSSYPVSLSVPAEIFYERGTGRIAERIARFISFQPHREASG